MLTFFYSAWYFTDHLGVLRIIPSLAERIRIRSGEAARVSSKRTKKNFGSNRNKPKQDLFRLCFGLFHETKHKKFRFVSVCFCLFRCFEPILKQPKQTELFQNKTEATLNFLKICSLLNCFLIQAKHRKALFRHRSETTKTNCF